MKDAETRQAFITARAEKKSYSTISKELGISKATCTSWEREYKDEIATRKQERLEELYTAYGMTREARIEALGAILKDLDNAIAQKPLDERPAEKLLELRLKYGRAIKEEYIAPAGSDIDGTLDGLLEQYNQLYTESRAGNYSPADIRAQLNILDAKKDVLYNLADEHTKEKYGAFGMPITAKYTSEITRHDSRRDA